MAATTSTVNINGVSITLTPGSTVVVNGISATLDAHGHVNVTTSATPEQSVANDVADDSGAEHETEADEGPLLFDFEHTWLLNLLAASNDYPYIDEFNLEHKGIVLHSVEYQTQDGSTKHYESFAIDNVNHTDKGYLIAGRIEDGSWRSLYASGLFPKSIELGSLPLMVLNAAKQSVANDTADGSDSEHETDEDTEADEGPRVLAFDHAWLLNLLAASTHDYPYLDTFNLDHKGIVLRSVEYQTQDGFAKHYESFAIDNVKDTGKGYLIAGKIEDGSWRSLYADRLFPEFIELGSLPLEILDATK